MNEDQEYLEQTRAEMQARQDTETVEDWENNMHRVFKGIITRGQRRRNLHEVGKRIDAGTHGLRETHDRKPRNRGGGPYLRPEVKA